MDLSSYRPLFLVEAKKKLELSRHFYKVGDVESLQVCFHTLRGMSGTMGFDSISRLAAALEESEFSADLVAEGMDALAQQLGEVEAGASPTPFPELELRLKKERFS